MKPVRVEPAVYLRERPNRWLWFGFMRLGRRLEIPRRLRALVRARESSLIALAALVGVISGLVVAAMGTAVDLLHELFFHLQPGERLSARLANSSDAGGPSARSIRSKPTHCTAAACR